MQNPALQPNVRQGMNLGVPQLDRVSPKAPMQQNVPQAMNPSELPSGVGSSPQDKSVAIAVKALSDYLASTQKMQQVPQPMPPMGGGMPQGGFVSPVPREDLAKPQGIGDKIIKAISSMMGPASRYESSPVKKNYIPVESQPAIEQQPSIPSQDNFKYDATPYMVDTKTQMDQPTPEWHKLLQEYFPNEATQSALTIGNESGFRTKNDQGGPLVNENKNGTLDRGPWQINDKTFNHYFQNFPNTMKKLDINSYEDMDDPRKSTAMAELIVNSLTGTKGPRVGFGQWFGPAAQGYNTYGDKNIYDTNREKIKKYQEE